MRVSFRIALAGQVIGVSALYEQTRTFCKNYLTDAPASFEVAVTPADIAFEREKNDREGTVRYDVRFDAIAPTAANDAAQQDVIRLIINVEAQTAFNPGYPLTKRAIYYCSRMISAQHGPIFKKSEYGKIRKVYSIWVCTKPSDEFQNTLTRYSIRPEQLIGRPI